MKKQGNKKKQGYKLGQQGDKAGKTIKNKVTSQGNSEIRQEGKTKWHVKTTMNEYKVNNKARQQWNKANRVLLLVEIYFVSIMFLFYSADIFVHYLTELKWSWYYLNF